MPPINYFAQKCFVTRFLYWKITVFVYCSEVLCTFSVLQMDCRNHSNHFNVQQNVQNLLKGERNYVVAFIHFCMLLHF